MASSPALSELFLNVQLDLPATAKAFNDGWQRISWTKYKTFNSCQVSWFFENYAVPVERAVYSEESTNSIGGTITQRIWESIINDRVFARFNSREELIAWARQQTRALFHLLCLPYEAQHVLSREQIRKYFRTQLGKDRIAQMQKEYGLDPLFTKGMQPKFVDPVKFAEKHKSVEIFIEKQADKFAPMVARFDGMQVDFNRMLSEQFLAPKYGETTLAGAVDFLYNVRPMNRPFTELSQLQDGYIILDGKENVHQYTQNGQLYFYGTMLHLLLRKTPSTVGFIDWTKAEFVWYPFEPTHIEQIKRGIVRMQDTAYKLNQSLQALAAQPSGQISINDIPFLEYKPERMTCMFCGMAAACKEAKAMGYGPHRGKDYMTPFKRAVPEGVDRSGSTTAIEEISF